MPEEKVATRKFGEIDAYLVEARSIGGLSGSPVFVMLGPHSRVDGNACFVNRATIGLLGLMHGHFDLPEPLEDAVRDDFSQESVNVGIAIVVPAERIRELLFSPEFTQRRQAAGLRWRGWEMMSQGEESSSQ